MREESASIAERMRKGPYTVSTDGSNDSGSGSKQFPVVVRTINRQTGLVESQMLALPVCNGPATGKYCVHLIIHFPFVTRRSKQVVLLLP